MVSNWLRGRKGVLAEGNSACEGLEVATNVLLSWEEEEDSPAGEDSSCPGWRGIKLDKCGKARIVKVLERQAK